MIKNLDLFFPSYYMMVTPEHRKERPISTDTPSPELQEVDPDLLRRVAWGLLAHRTKAEIAAVEGISLAECRAYCATPGMFASMNVWANVLERRYHCGTSSVKGLVGWAIDFMVENAAERLDRSAWWRVDQLVGLFMQYCFGVVVGWFIAYLDGVMGRHGAKRKRFGSWRQGCVDQVCWAVEIAIQQQMLDQQGEAYLTAADEIFRRAIADKEIFELGIGDELGIGEALAGKRPAAAWNPAAEAVAPDEAPERAVAREPEVLHDHAAPFDPWVVGSGPTMTSGELAESSPTMTAGEIAGSSPAMTTESSGNSCLTLSWRAPEPAIQRCEATIPDVRTGSTRPRLVQTLRHDELVERPPIVRNLLYESVRYKRRRCSSPPVVRLRPIERAA